MEQYFQTTALALVGVFLTLLLSGNSKELSLLLCLAVCAVIISGVLEYLRPVISFINRLQQLMGLDSQVINPLLKSVGIGIVGELCALVCSDSGNAALAKAIHLLTASMILWLCVPLFEMLLDVFLKVLGEG